MFDKINYQLDSRDVPNVKKTAGKMKRVTFEQAREVIEMIYKQMPANQRGGLSREDWWYTYKFKNKRQIIIMRCITMNLVKQQDMWFTS